MKAPTSYLGKQQRSDEKPVRVYKQTDPGSLALRYPGVGEELPLERAR
jgi:hypothetical protein